MFCPCLLIPVYNHGALVESTWARLRPLQLPCLLVDDGSEPGTATVLDKLAASEPLITLLRLPFNQGKGAAVLHGITEALRLGYTHALQIDADGQHDTNDIPALLAMAEREPDALISGAPQYGDDIPKARLYGRYITHFWVWVETLSFEIVDSMCGFRVYPVAVTHALAEQKSVGQRMTFDTEIMVRLHWAGTPVRFLPTRVSYPENGISHFRALHDNVQISVMHTKLVCEMLWRVCRGAARRAPTHWSQQQERGSAWGLRFSLWCYRRAGARALHALLYPVIAWFFLFSSTARAASMDFLSRVQGKPASLRDSFRHFLSFGRAIVHKLQAWNGEIRHTDVAFHQRQLLLDQKASGRGCVILTSHLGNTDICRALSGYVEGLHLNVLLFTRNARAINNVLQSINDASMEVLEIDEVDPGTAMLLNDKISRGEFVVIAADRTPPGTTHHRVTAARFLGQPVLLPQGPFILASLLECPVYLMFALHNGQQYEIFIEPFANPIELPRRQRELLLPGVVQRYAERLEHYCRLAPLQWFNFFDFWHGVPPPDRKSGLPDD